MNLEKQSTNLQMTLREVNRVGEVKKNIPKLRFKGYEDAWEQRRLEEIFLKIRNAFVGTSTPYYVEKNQGGHFYIESNNVKHGKINHDTEVFINEEFYQNQKDKWLKTGDIVMVQSGHVGHSAVIPEYLNNSAAHALIMFQEYKIETNPYFINFQFQTESMRNKIDSITTGNTIKHILASDMKLFSISNTQKKEADKLGDFFISLDNLITLHQRKYDSLKSMKKTLLSKMFPKNGEVVPEIRFKGYTDAWEQRKAKRLFVSRVDKGYPDLPVLSATQDKGMVRRDENGINIHYDEKNKSGYKRVMPGQFVIHLRSFQGGFAYSEVEGITSPAYTVFDFQELDKHIPEFWKYVFSSKDFIRRLEKVTYGIRDGRSIGFEDFLTLKFNIPEKREQKVIAEILAIVNNLITLHQRKLDELKNMKKTLLQQMFV